MTMALLKDRYAVYMQLMRLDKPIGTLLLLWPTLWALWIAGQGAPKLELVIIFTVGTFLMRSAGCVMNDYADRDYDGHVARTQARPFARGVVSTKEALILSCVLLLLSLLLLLPLNSLTWLLSLPAAFLAATYPFTKRFFPIPQAYLGLAFSFGIPMGFAAQTGAVPWLAWWLVLANFFWTIAYDTIYAICDKPDDLNLGIKTSAITFGRYDVLAVMLCHVVFLGLMAGLGWYLQLHLIYYVALLIAAGLMVKQYQDIRQRDRASCFKAFLDNNRVGAAVFLGLVVHYLV